MGGKELIVVTMSFQAPWDKPDFETAGEVVDFRSLVFEVSSIFKSFAKICHLVSRLLAVYAENPSDAQNYNTMMESWYPLYTDLPRPLRICKKMDRSGPDQIPLCWLGPIDPIADISL
ncbi:hypothetical protein D9757_008673 [Collybiopsis confluens]|uniref:Uncharacterized protein n=1 Tax=Collybiopsis confluens TaxID=2823264 RepID=A0A8H5H441_9AGAR|nr:hypothetical protein D9757_008673 [Collybiopsis confluens]